MDSALQGKIMEVLLRLCLFTLLNNSYFGTVVVSSEGKLVYTSWINRYQVGTTVAQQNECDIYGFCCPNESCDLKNLPICTCFNRF